MLLLESDPILRWCDDLVEGMDSSNGAPISVVISPKWERSSKKWVEDSLLRPISTKGMKNLRLIFTFLLPGGRAENPGGVIKILKRIRLADFACAECETESEKTWGVLKLKPKLCPSAPWPTTISKYCIRSNVDIPRRPQTLVILLMVANERLGGVGAP